MGGDCEGILQARLSNQLATILIHPMAKYFVLPAAMHTRPENVGLGAAWKKKRPASTKQATNEKS